MYFPGVGELLDEGFVENGPGKDFLRYPVVEKGVDNYISTVREPIKAQLHDYIAGKPDTGSDPPTDLHEAERRIRTKLDRNVPPLAKMLLMQEYSRASSIEGPVKPEGMPEQSEFQVFEN